ncbi:hypothetical protein VaNZ11_007658 [Volvox africanus]|uniref:Phospholipid scramblase n=1 Tax=Volvox africanus TaxID=51714 RepID=A0ABQ5S3A8_9CHLO|nr:hypothetical protein VaNZ11_007658 [Volvox africanus]
MEENRFVLAAPGMQLMDNLEAVPGVVVKETTQVVDAVMAAVGGAYEAENKYYVRAMPPNVNPGREHGEAGAWRPTTAQLDALPQVYFVGEESDCFLRVILAAFGGLNLRALTLHFFYGNADKYLVERPCMLGGCCCCPLEMRLYQNGQQKQLIGAVIEDFDNYCARCFDCCCLCIFKHKVLVGPTRDSLVHKYSLVNSACCCGRVDNCCGGTCCRPSFFIDVVEPDGSLAAVAQKTYGGGEGCADCCRCAFDFNNYILPFPPKANHFERLLLLTGLLSVEYAYHSRTGGENDN